ncbi:hypothetical protein IGI04_030956, partial [Brassica rapa subsp. trilocularis]
DHLINPASKRWNETRVRQLFEEEDVSIVLNTRFNLRSGDSLVWGFSRSGVYDSKSGYKLLESIQAIGQSERLRFPWILWHLWKARNSFCFEQKRFTAANIFKKAAEESSIWFKLFQKDQEEESSTRVLDIERAWQKPPMGFVKCNLGCSWSASSQHTGASWVIRDFRGQVMEHSRRSFTETSSNLEADLISLCWTAKDLHTLHWNRVIMEISSAHTLEALNNPQWFPGLSNTIEQTRQALNCFQNCYVEVVNADTNRVAEKIAASVTKDGRFQSYIARGGPSWLNDIILAEVSNSPSSYQR